MEKNYIVNTTFVIQPKIHGVWFEFFTKNVLEAVKTQGYTILAFTRILHDQVEEHYSYSLQVEMDDITEMQKYKNEIIAEYALMAQKMYSEQALYFTSVLKKVE